MGYIRFLPKTYIRILLPRRNTLAYRSRPQYRDTN